MDGFPIFELLDARGFAVFLVNARDAKHVPGRKTDVSDAQWLLRLHTHGLLRASFRPKDQIESCVRTCVSLSVCSSKGVTYPTHAGRGSRS